MSDNIFPTTGVECIPMVLNSSEERISKETFYTAFILQYTNILFSLSWINIKQAAVLTMITILYQRNPTLKCPRYLHMRCYTYVA